MSEWDSASIYFDPKVKLIIWPRSLPEEKRQEYLAYLSPENLMRISAGLAEYYLFESVSCYGVGLTGSLGRGEAQVLSDIDLALFIRTEDALRLAYQSDMVFDIGISHHFLTIDGLIGVDMENVYALQKTGMPGWAKEYGAPSANLHLMALPYVRDERFIELDTRLNPMAGLSSLASLGRDLKLYDPQTGTFEQDTNHWMYRLYLQECGL